MKDKIGFNPVFAVLAFPIGLALSKDINFENFTLKKPVIDTFYLVVFISLIIFMFIKQKK